MDKREKKPSGRLPKGKQKIGGKKNPGKKGAVPSGRTQRRGISLKGGGSTALGGTEGKKGLPYFKRKPRNVEKKGGLLGKRNQKKKKKKKKKDKGKGT